MPTHAACYRGGRAVTLPGNTNGASCKQVK